MSSRYETSDEAYKFTKLLVELCGLYHIGSDGMIYDDQERQLRAKQILSAKRPFTIFKEGMTISPSAVILNPYNETVGVSNIRKWFFIHIESICAYLTKRIMLTIIDSFVHGNRIIYNKYDGALLEFADEIDAEILKDIYEIPANYFLSLDYNKKSSTAYAISKLDSQEVKNEYVSVKQETWEILAILFYEIFSSDYHAISGPADMEKAYTHKATIKDIPEIDAKLHVLINLVSMLEKGVRLLDNYELPVTALQEHLPKLKDYHQITRYVSSTCNPKIDRQVIAVLVDCQGKEYPHEDTYHRLIADLKPQIYEITPSDSRVPQPLQSFGEAIKFYKAQDMSTSYDIIPQNPLVVSQLERNDLIPHEDSSVKENVEAHIAEVLSKYVPAAQRDYASEIDAIMKDKIEMNLLMTLKDDTERQKWLPGVKADGALLNYKGVAINLEEHIYNLAAIQQIAAKYNYTIGPQVPQGYIPWRPFIALYSIINNCVNENNVLDEKFACRVLEDKFDITKNNVYKPVAIPEYSNWQPSDDKTYYKFLDPGCKFIMFKSRNGALIYGLIRFESNWKSLLLPVTNYVKDNENPVSFFVMPEGKAPLLNLDLMKKYKHAKIILTDDLELAYKHGTEYAMSDVIWTSWYGAEAAIADVDWEKLKGRKVFCVFREDDEHLKKKLSTMLKVLDVFENQIGEYLTIIGIHEKESCKRYKHEEFIALGRRNKVNIPDGLKHKSKLINLNRTHKHKAEYIIKDVIKAKTLTMIFAPSGQGKTWLSLSIALAVANAKDVFEGWKTSSTPRGVAFFSGEMTTEDLEDRVTDLNYIYNDSENENILAPPPKVMNLCEKDDQKVVDGLINAFNRENDVKISLLILDNLNTLAEDATTKSGWDKFFKWTEEKKKEGITVIVIHHPNKEGKYYGTSHIVNRLDLMIHAADKDYIMARLRKVFGDQISQIKERLKNILSDNVTMFLSYDKKRLSRKSKLQPCQISLLDIATDEINWKVTPPDYESLLNKYGYSLHDFSDSLMDELTYGKLVFPVNTESLPIDSPKDSYSTGEGFLSLDTDQQGEIIEKMWLAGQNARERKTEAMAYKLGIQKRELDDIRKDSGTRVSDLKSKYPERFDSDYYKQKQASEDGKALGV